MNAEKESMCPQVTDEMVAKAMYCCDREITSASMRAALEAVVPMLSTQMWQPIETAPMDGTIVDLWMRGPRSPSGYRAADCWFARDNWWQEFGRDGATHPANMVGDEPAYWTPRPLPPSARPEGVKL